MKENPYESPSEDKPRWSWRGPKLTRVPVWPFWMLLIAMAIAALIGNLLGTMRTP